MKSSNIVQLLSVAELPSYLTRVEDALAKILSVDDKFIREPLSRIIKARSKRLRPSLLIAIVVNHGASVSHKVIDSCVAVELVHVASLIHDDIIDRADSRWGVPTISAKEGVNTAIILGDFLFAEAHRQAAKVSQDVVDVIASTIEALCSGELNDMRDEFNLSRSMKSLITTMEGKTAALISATCAIGGICAGLKAQEIKSLYEYGKDFGVSFQIIDDLLDFLSTQKLLGKPVGNDVREGIYTLPLVIALGDSESSTLKTMLKKPTNLAAITRLLLENGAIEKSVALANQYNRAAINRLSSFENNLMKSSLSSLPDNYLKWAFSNLVDTRYKKDLLRILSTL